MKQSSDNKATVSDRALEMVMRDVLDGLLEISLESAFASHSDDMTILEITPERPVADTGQATQAADIIHFPTPRRACG